MKSIQDLFPDGYLKICPRSKKSIPLEERCYNMDMIIQIKRRTTNIWKSVYDAMNKKEDSKLFWRLEVWGRHYCSRCGWTGKWKKVDDTEKDYTTTER